MSAPPRLDETRVRRPGQRGRARRQRLGRGQCRLGQDESADRPRRAAPAQGRRARLDPLRHLHQGGGQRDAVAPVRAPRRLVRGTPADLQNDLAKLEGRKDFSSRGDLDRARELFARALETPGGLRIETIHAFCGRRAAALPARGRHRAGLPRAGRESCRRNLGRRRSAIWGAASCAEVRSLIDAARIVAEAGGGKDWACFAHFCEARGDRSLLSGAWRHSHRRRQDQERRSSAPDESVGEILERAMGADLPRNDLARLCSTLPADKKSDAEACRDACLRAVGRRRR